MVAVSRYKLAAFSKIEGERNYLGTTTPAFSHAWIKAEPAATIVKVNPAIPHHAQHTFN
jgi:hypothetical protein